MARIPEDEVERLKREVSVERLAEARGIKLTRHGANLLGRCPFLPGKPVQSSAMQPSEHIYVPDGLIAAMTLLKENRLWGFRVEILHRIRASTNVTPRLQ
jgi:hypothetical protein